MKAALCRSGPVWGRVPTFGAEQVSELHFRRLSILPLPDRPPEIGSTPDSNTLHIRIDGQIAPPGNWSQGLPGA